MRKGLIGALAVFVLAIALPWLVAYWSYSSGSGYLGVERGRQLRCVYADKTHFDAYKTAVWFDESLRLVGEDGVIHCNGNRLAFPSGKNVALVRSPDDVIFVALADEYFTERKGHSEIIYVLGKVPHFKSKRRGMIDLVKIKDDRVIEKEWNTFVGNLTR